MENDVRYAKLLADLPEALIREDSFLNDLLTHSQCISVRKGDYLLRTGEACQNAYFINKGVYLHQFINNKGEEIPVGFSTDDFYPFLSAISYLTETPSDYEIKAIEEGELICFSRNLLEGMSRNYPLFTAYYQHAIMRVISKMYTIFTIRQAYKSEDFMVWLYGNHASLINRVPDKYIARFMGISTSWYCKLKKRSLN